MRKAALFFAVMLAASLSTAADAKKKAAPAPDPAVAAQGNTNKFMMDAANPYGATSKPAAPAKKAKRSKKK